MRYFSKLVISFAISIVLSTAAFADNISYRDVSQYVGQTVTVVGKVSQVSTGNSGAIFINFGGRFPNHTFYGVIFRKNVGLFPGVRDLTSHTVELTGKIQIYKGKPQIVVRSSGQIQVLK